MNPDRERIILGKAEEITKKSEQFQLIHATYAARAMIKEIVKNYYKERYEDLSRRTKERLQKGLDVKSELVEKKELDSKARESSFHIDVEYIETKTEEMARVIKIENAFVINLPRSLAERVMDDDGNYNYETIQKIRGLMSHELGHLILHTDELLRIQGTQGSLEIDDKELEAEASLFGDELIRLRRERNERFYRDRAYKSF